MLAKTGQLLQTPNRLLVQVGLLGPALGGQCILDFPLLTALNVCALQFTGRNFTSLSQDTNILQHLLGIPALGTEQTYSCVNPWVKRVEINLGPLYQNEILHVGVIEQQGKYVGLRVQIGPEEIQTIKLDHQACGSIEIEGRRFIFKVINALTIQMDIDESKLTLGTVPPQKKPHHVITNLDGQDFLVKSGGTLVKSLLLEIANQVAPAMIPAHLIGDISTPRMVPSRASHLPLPYLNRYHIGLLLMGAGPVQIKLELGNIAGFSESQLDILKKLFNYTFYHPELKKIFGKP